MINLTPPLQRRTEREKADLMTFEEMRMRLANRDAIREKQEQEERVEEEREKELAALQRREALAEKRRQQQQEAEASSQQLTLKSKQKQEQQQKAVAAAADTSSSEVEKKQKVNFLKEASKIVVKVLEEFRKDDATAGKIKNKEDFKYLAKKVSLVILRINWGPSAAHRGKRYVVRVGKNP